MEKQRKIKKKRPKLGTTINSKLSKVQPINIICNDPFEKYLEYTGELHDLRKIILSPNAQEFIKCRIGDEITAVTPWMFVSTSKIKESIKLYQNTSDFYSIKPFMDRYLDPDVLLGCYNNKFPKQEQEFYICTTKEARDEVVKILRKERQDVLRKINSSFSFDALSWKTAKRKESIKIKDTTNRSLFELEVNLPIVSSKIKSVQETIDGCTKPEKIKNMRKRVNNCVQSIIPAQNKNQTNINDL